MRHTLSPALLLGLVGVAPLCVANAANTAAIVGENPAQAREIVHVSNGAELTEALRSETKKMIVLRDGVYDSDTYFRNEFGHQMDAEHSDKAVLRAGLSIGGNKGHGGAIVRGLTFDVTNTSKMQNGHVILVWGTARNTVLGDLRIDGHGVADTGIVIRQPEGAQLKGITAQNFLSDGIRVQSVKRMEFEDSRPVKTPVVLEDIKISNVSRNPPLESNGSAESCIWAGETVVADRLELRNCAWMGLWTGTATNGSVFRNVSIDGSPQGIGVYLGHYTINTSFEHLKIGPDVAIGVKCEWGAPQWNNIAGCHGVTVSDAIIRTTCGAVFLGEGATDTTIKDSLFVGQKAFVLGEYKGNGNFSEAGTNRTEGVASDAIAHLQGPLGPLLKEKCPGVVK